MEITKGLVGTCEGGVAVLEFGGDEGGHIELGGGVRRKGREGEEKGRKGGGKREERGWEGEKKGEKGEEKGNLTETEVVKAGASEFLSTFFVIWNGADNKSILDSSVIFCFLRRGWKMNKKQ